MPRNIPVLPPVLDIAPDIFIIVRGLLPDVIVWPFVIPNAAVSVLPDPVDPPIETAPLALNPVVFSEIRPPLPVPDSVSVEDEPPIVNACAVVIPLPVMLTGLDAPMPSASVVALYVNAASPVMPEGPQYVTCPSVPLPVTPLSVPGAH